MRYSRKQLTPLYLLLGAGAGVLWAEFITPESLITPILAAVSGAILAALVITWFWLRKYLGTITAYAAISFITAILAALAAVFASECPALAPGSGACAPPQVARTALAGLLAPLPALLASMTFLMLVKVIKAVRAGVTALWRLRE